jgi:MFS family permease
MLIAATSEAWCFLIDGISYIAVIASLLMMQLDVPVRRIAKSTLAELAEGWTYVAESVPIRTILLLFAAVSLMGMPFVVLMPVFAAKVLNGGAHTLGFLMGAMGVGALISALSLAARKSVRGLIRMIPMAAGVFGVGLIGFGLSHVFWLSMLTVMVAGGGMMQGMAASNTIIQTLVSEDKRGRVMSYYTMAFVGMAPFGSLLAGVMAHKIPTSRLWIVAGPVLAGAQWTVIINGVVVVAGAVWFFTQLPALRRTVRPLYQELGIIPAAKTMAVEQVQS